MGAFVKLRLLLLSLFNPRNGTKVTGWVDDIKREQDLGCRPEMWFEKMQQGGHVSQFQVKQVAVVVVRTGSGYCREINDWPTNLGTGALPNFGMGGKG